MTDEQWRGRSISVYTQTGVWQTEYTFKGRPCRRYELVSTIASKYAAYSWIWHDLQDVKVWMEAAHKLAPPTGTIKSAGSVTHAFFPSGTDHRLLKAYFYAAITLYGKCFTNAKGRKLKLETSNLGQEFQEAHTHAMELRHTITAHAGSAGEWSRPVLLVTDAMNEPHKPIYFDLELNRLGFVDDRTFPVPFLSLVEHAIGYADQKRLALFAKLKQDEATETLRRCEP